MEIVGWFILIVWVVAIIAAGLGVYILYKIDTDEILNKRR